MVFNNCQNEPVILIDNPMENVKVKRIYKLITKGEKALLKEEFYDTFGNIIKEIEYEKDYFSDNQTPTVLEFFYDKKGENLIAKKYGYLDGEVFRHEFYENKYNDKGQLIEEKITDSIDNNIDIDYHSYNEFGLKDTSRSPLFYDGKLHWNDSYTLFEYDENKHLKKKIYQNYSRPFEKHYQHDKDGNLLKFEGHGMFQCGEDIAKRTYKYNKNNQIVLEEIWNATGENWAYEYVYKKGILISKTYQERLLIETDVHIGFEPPPPPHYSQNDLQKDYTKMNITYYYYNDKQQQIKSVRKVLNEKGIGDSVFVFEYEY
jgi:hypothetical protein